MRPACSLTRTARRPAPQWIEEPRWRPFRKVCENGHFRARPQALFVSLSTKYILCRVRFRYERLRSWMTLCTVLTRRPLASAETRGSADCFKRYARLPTGINAAFKTGAGLFLSHSLTDRFSDAGAYLSHEKILYKHRSSPTSPHRRVRYV